MREVIKVDADNFHLIGLRQSTSSLAAPLQLHVKNRLRYQPLMAEHQLSVGPIDQRYRQRRRVHGFPQQVSLVHEDML